MRTQLLTAALAGLLLAAPTQAADLDKYLPDGATTYVQIRSKNLFTADVVRKTVPLLFDKYGDQIAGLYKLAKQFNPQAPDLPEEQIKQGLAELKKPEVIAKGFDVAKDYAPDIVISGTGEDPKSFLVLVKCDEAVTPELVEGFVPLINASAQGQLKIEKMGEGKTAIFAVTPQQAPITFYVALPEAGVVCFGGDKAPVEAALKGKEGKVDPDLKKLLEKRDAKDFVFAAGVKGKGDERETYVGNLVLDKDVTAKVNAIAPTAEKAKAWAEKFNEGVGEAVGKIKENLGEGAKDLKDQLEKIKATADGKTVTLDAKIPGAVLEKLLAKDKE
jgi:hypothetical protein